MARTIAKTNPSKNRGRRKPPSAREPAPVCPKCGSKKVVPIFYGYPSAESMEPLLDAVKRGEVVLGGCCIDGDEPALSCRDCGHRWGKR